MPIHSSRWACAALLAGCCLAGCAKSTAPKGWLSPAVDAQRAAHGGWLSLQMKGDSRRANHEGELLAIQADSVYMLEHGACIALPTAHVIEATLTAYEANSGLLAGWTLAGTLSTASHGAWLLLSAPVWIITGAVQSASESRAARTTIRSSNWEDARPYARFPQGLPEGLDRASLRSKEPTRGSHP
ncbi:MAG TPA: hypothetical protein VJY35_01410 [Candidatus Eisenbacteria bacterium]|nr:hypothetical protein [Candidatus Eisenbacteria bacterium]